MPYEKPAQPLDSDDFEDTPEGLQSRWTVELGAALKNQENWWNRAEKIVKRYLDERDSSDSRDFTPDGTTRTNLFHADVDTMHALLVGQIPQVDVSRRFADAEDEQARVAGEMLERVLNTDIETDDNTDHETLLECVKDRLLAGMAWAICRYEVQTEQAEELNGAQVPAYERKVADSEYVCVDYAYWKDVLWSPGRTYREMRWVAFRKKMSKRDFRQRFGKEKLSNWVASTDKYLDSGDKDIDPRVLEHMRRCDVWEIWSKEDRKVYWFVKDGAAILDVKDDPLGLENFWPFPRPMVANLTTTKFLPLPDFAITQDLYDEIETVSTRITLLERCVRVAGVYNKNNEEIKRLVNETSQNELIGVEGWEGFAEKGGVKGAIDWLPLDMVVSALQVLRDYRTELIALKNQIDGMSDIMRGQASTQATATEQAIKARFASVRVQSLQDEVARFASDIQKIKAEIISKHFDPQTIILRSNIERTPDAQFAQQAVELIKSRFYDYRISVDPDSVALQDFAALKQERFEFGQAIAGFIQSALPMVQMMASVPGAAMPTVQFVLTLGQQMAAGLKGSDEMQGIFDSYVAQLKTIAQQLASQPPQPPQPDPKMQAAQIKAQAEMGKAQASQQQTMLDTQAHQAKTAMDMQAAKMQHQMDMQKMAAGVLSQEAKARTDALTSVNQVTQDHGGAR